ncbi:tRNA pseudouridine(38-40) synthase TruA [Flavihumibacter sp. CACIAM 22H1]|uniref:tRNA pseudouridine(38-40) synthase TruA n=1 Tax=Flavihumibacter sp. CACIAM 22H1 TaxID=1812911 RepID=UPI0007A90004|nr:tRNA pseudouridine(38-40) synthase TruA [Flavihumibacter sp. CACIAM 22H1]KYP14980.1 MAG: tRNA pseudouridine(38,39,40) synthase TruA [Flavihumibacter sp. CACIAM 22H1]
MKRYFLELSYMGTGYAGFQRQENAKTVQSELEKALQTLLRQPVVLTGSSRTDAGVHALQNYFHFDLDVVLNERLLYNLNAVLPGDIAVRNLHLMPATAHSRFDAVSREYRYYIYRDKDPFKRDRAYYFPYQLDMESMQQAALMLMDFADFTSFSKRNTQVKTFICRLERSEWTVDGAGGLVYYVKGNRFLRGMVRALTATMLKLGRGRISLEEFRAIVASRDCTKADFAVPPHGLFLEKVNYPDLYFKG